VWLLRPFCEQSTMVLLADCNPFNCFDIICGVLVVLA
jgi:hypothetical protein